jgi:hypothetical protein
VQHVDWTVAITQLGGSFSTLIAVLLAWMQNNKRIDDLRGEMRNLRDDFRESLRSESALIRSEMRRVEEVMDARLKHLEEREAH